MSPSEAEEVSASGFRVHLSCDPVVFRASSISGPKPAPRPQESKPAQCSSKKTRNQITVQDSRREPPLPSGSLRCGCVQNAAARLCFYAAVVSFSVRSDWSELRVFSERVQENKNFGSPSPGSRGTGLAVANRMPSLSFSP